MIFPALLQMSTRDPMFWIMVIIAASFILIAIAMIAIAVFVSRAVKTVNRMEDRLRSSSPLSRDTCPPLPCTFPSRWQ
jgi:amino acid transporter